MYTTVMLTTTPSVCLSEPKLTSPTMKICSVLSLLINRTLTKLNLPLTESNFILGEVIFFMINNSYLRKCNECYERNQKFSLLFRFTKYCFLCTFFGNNNNDINNNNNNNNNSNNNKREMVRLLCPLVTCNVLQGNFSCWPAKLSFNCSRNFKLIRLSYFFNNWSFLSPDN